jgi:hypothetical protein
MIGGQRRVFAGLPFGRVDVGAALDHCYPSFIGTLALFECSEKGRVKDIVVAHRQPAAFLRFPLW